MRSHKNELKPSILLCLVCLAIVHRIRPRWVSVSIKEASAVEEVSAQRLSRLCTRSISLFENVIAKITQMGRPHVQQDDTASKLSLQRALLQVATEILSRLSTGKSTVRELLVGAYLRLKSQHQELTQRDFCSYMALPDRTLRHWLSQPREKPSPTPVAETKTPAKKPRLRRPRFGFEVTIPGTQMGSDTTDFTAFGVGLKLMATQDIGGRDQNLFEAVIVDDHENADLVSQMLCQAIGSNKGVQVICDQGTPYMANKTKETLEQLEADHTPQREGDPLGKATVEKAFDTIKRIARPLLDVTDHLAKKIQDLHQPELAKVTSTLVFTALLRAYQAGARATRRALNERASMSEETLLELSDRSREKAHAEDRSTRLLLTRVHQLYSIEQKLQTFIRNLRTFPLKVLQQAERAFGNQAHRDDIRKRGAYFAAIARNINVEYQNLKAQQREQQKQEMLRQQEENETKQRKSSWHENPCLWLSAALIALSHQWMPAESKLLFCGHGLGLAWMKKSIARMLELHGPTITQYLVAGVLVGFKNSHQQKIGEAGINAIQSLLDRNLPFLVTKTKNTDCIRINGSTILRKTGLPTRSVPHQNC